jgi:hypothetical protein
MRLGFIIENSFGRSCFFLDKTFVFGSSRGVADADRGALPGPDFVLFCKGFLVVALPAGLGLPG